MAKIVVKKFGGTSVGTVERIEAVAERVSRAVHAGEKPVIVASAMSGETNRLIGLAREIDSQYRGRAYDMLVASGEQVSISLLAIALEKRGLLARSLLAHQLGSLTDSLFSKARIQKVDGEKLLRLVDQGVIPVVAGFQGVDADLQITTLGRGGSDTSAVALAAAIKEQGREVDCEIYTDVPAVFSADPRLVKTAREIQFLSFEEMIEMASLGSKILHIRSVELAAKYGIPLHVRSSFEERPGTWIQEEVPESEKNEQEKESMEQVLVSSVTHEASVVVFKLFPVPEGTGFLASLFNGLTAQGVSVDIITQSLNEEGQRLAFSVSDEDVVLVEKFLSSFVDSNVNIVAMKDMSKISVVGVGMRNHPGVAARFFSTLARLEVPIHLVTTSEIKISAVIDRAQLEAAAKALHSEFELDQ